MLLLKVHSESSQNIVTEGSQNVGTEGSQNVGTEGSQNVCTEGSSVSIVHVRRRLSFNEVSPEVSTQVPLELSTEVSDVEKVIQ